MDTDNNNNNNNVPPSRDSYQDDSASFTKAQSSQDVETLRDDPNVKEDAGEVQAPKEEEEIIDGHASDKIDAKESSTNNLGDNKELGGDKDNEQDVSEGEGHQSSSQKVVDMTEVDQNKILTIDNSMDESGRNSHGFKNSSHLNSPDESSE